MVKMRLEQSTTTTPLMRQLVLFLRIAGGTSQYNRVHIMPGIMLSATQRHGMLKVIEIVSVDLFKLGKTASSIIASIVLCFQLGLYLLISERFFNALFADTSSMPFSTLHYPTVLSIRISPLSLKTARAISFIVFMKGFLSALCLIAQSCLFTFLGSISSVISSVQFAVMFTMFSAILLFALRYLISVPFLVLAAIFTMLIIMLLAAFSTPVLKTIFVGLASCETLKRKWLLAFATLLARGIILGYHIHDKGQLLVRPGDICSIAQASSYLPPLYHETAPKASLGGVS